MKLYDPRQWYWIVAGDNTRAFSSAAGDYVPVDDATFVAWQDDGTVPSRIASEAELAVILASAFARPVRASVLDAYQDAHAKDIVGRTFFKVLFNHENRLRAIERQLGLNGSPANLTANQARNAIKALM